MTRRLDQFADRSEVQKLVANPKLVAKHAFFPLLHKKLSQRRFKILDHDENGRTIRGHKNGKGSTKKVRPIHYATHLDAAIYSYYSREVLQSLYEAKLKENPGLSACITAYRRLDTGDGRTNKNNIHFAKEVFDFIRKKGPCCAMAFDIESFFTNLDHKILKRSWRRLLGTKSLPKDHYNIYKSITNYSYILLDDLRKKDGGFDEAKLADTRKRYGIHAFFSSPKEMRQAIIEGELRVYKNQYHNQKEGEQKSIRGIPQGLPISSTLANLYLFEFDQLVHSKVVEGMQGLYRRYSDDIVVVCDEKDRQEVNQFLISTIKKFRLEISTSKTEICVFARSSADGREVLESKRIIEKEGKEILKPGMPFRYLGFEFYGDKILLKSSNISKFYRRMVQAIRKRSDRIRAAKEKRLSLENGSIIYRRRFYRNFSHYGAKPRRIPEKRSGLRYDSSTGEYRFSTCNTKRKYRGNYLTYVYRASKIMEEPAIRKQMKNHWKVLRRAIVKAEKGLQD